MLQRDRRSANVLTLPRADGTPAKVQAPGYLTKAERVLFTEITESAKHLTPAGAPLIASLAQCMTIAGKSSCDPASFAAFEKATRLQVSLMTKLRITPQSRYSAKSIALRPTAAPSAYDVKRVDDD